MDLKTLWQYMQVDAEADRFETAMRQSENRQTLIRQRRFIKEQQESMAKLQQDVAGMSDRADAIADEAERLEKNLNMLLESIEAAPPKTPEEVAEKAAAVKHLADTLAAYETELAKMRKDAEQRDRQQREIRSHAAKTLAEYNALKKLYDVEYAQDDAKLKKLRRATEAEAKKVEPSLLARYKETKQQVVPAMAKLVNDQCSGCFMSLPGATLLEIESGDRLIKCDNCGRILYIEK